MCRSRRAASLLSVTSSSVASMSTERLPDRWHTRDFPVLLATARILESEGRTADSQEEEFQQAANCDEQDLVRALQALKQAGYIEAEQTAMLAGNDTVWATGLTERGRRAVGLWPGDDAADALIDALRQAEESTTDPDERSAIRRAWSSLGGVSRDVMVDVVAAVVARQSGLG